MFSVNGAVGSGADNPDSKIIYRAYRPTLSDPSTMERAIIQETNTAAAPTAGALTVNGINGAGSATLSVHKAAGVNQAVAIGHQLTIASGPAAGVYVITAATTIVQNANTTVSVTPNLRGATAGGEAITLTLGASGVDLIANTGSFIWLWDVELNGVLPLRTFEVNGPTGWSNFGQTTDGLKLIDCVIHDLSGGTFNERTSGRHEIYGCLSYNIGYATGDGGGHHHYIHHNNGSAKRMNLEACVMFNDEGVAMQMYDSAGASGAEQNIDFLSCLGFNVGQLNTIASLGDKDAQMFIVGGTQEISSINCQNIYGFQPAGKGDIFFQIGQPGQLVGVAIKISNVYGYVAGTGFGAIYMPATIDGPGGGVLTFQSNTLRVKSSDATHNGRIINLAENGLTAKPGGYVWGPNTYYRIPGVGGNACGDETGTNIPLAFKDGAGGCRTLAQLNSDCGFSGDTLNIVDPTATLVVLLKCDKYESGRAWVFYYNYHSDNPIVLSSALLSTLLNNGDTYMLHDVRNVFAGVGGQAGTPVIGPSVWNGGNVNLPNTQLADPAMSGSQWGIGNEVAPPATAPLFNCFLLRRTAVSTTQSGLSKQRSRGLRHVRT